ncbi:MAG: tetratricopeptide repeat protein, partial [Chlamydiia bacterium]|nr:tetratricopeptide repeat protein [Chlamydiia bacterium]
PQIIAGREHYKKGNLENTLKAFTTALKLQKNINGRTEELEEAICQLKKERDTRGWEKNHTLYLPNEEQRLFKEQLDAYEDEEDMVGCFEALLNVEEKYSPYHHFLSAIVHEEKEDYNSAIQDYISLADENNPNAKACIEKAYNLLLTALEKSEDSNLLDRRDRVTMAFEKYLDFLSKESPQENAPTSFVCFNVSEGDIAKWLKKIFVPDLDRVGVKPIFCSRDLNVGQDLSSFQELARNADQVVVVCTPELKEKYEERKKAPVGLAQEIRIIKERYNDEDKANTIFPIYLKGSRKEACPTAYFEPIFGTKFNNAATDVSQFHYFLNAFELFASMRNIERETATSIRDAFLREMKTILTEEVNKEEIEKWRSEKEKKSQKLFDSIDHRVSSLIKMTEVPLPSQYFAGRTKELKKLHELCKTNHRVAITGIGGVGKTELALKYAEENKSYYRWSYFIAGNTMTEGLLDLADKLYVPKMEKIEERLELLKNQLSKQEKEFLLVFDGVDNPEGFEEIQKYLPEKGKCLLLTSRLKKEWNRLKFERLDLEVFTLEEAVTYLVKATGKEEEKEQAAILAKELGSLALALTCAASYIRMTGSSIEKYNNLFKDYSYELFEEENLTLKNEEKTVLTTWKIPVDTIEKKYPHVKNVMNFISLLAPAPIPPKLIEEWFKKNCSDNELELQDTLGDLVNYSMLNREKENYLAHLVVQKVTEYKLDENEKSQIKLQALQIGANLCKERNPKEVSVRRDLDVFIPHFKYLTHEKEEVIDEHKDLFIAILDVLWGYNHYEGKYPLSEKFSRKVLELRRSLLGDNHPDVATSLNNVGSTLEALGKHQEALTYQMQALELRKSLFGDNHPDVAASLNNVGATLGALGKHQEALTYQMQALELRKSLLGDNHPDNEGTLNTETQHLTISPKNASTSC